ncbi:MAG TPA: hypothetical protein VMX16_16495 [Terriglobia bacterium]|nr:hypothetical protein [Terriglobia bacterium]
MSNFQEQNPDGGEFQGQPPSPDPDWNRWWLLAVLMLFAATGASMIYAVRQHGAVQQLAQVNGQMASALRQTQAQIASLGDQVTALKAQAFSQPPAPATPSPKSEPARHRATRVLRRHASPSPYALLQHRISQQQQQINATQQALAQTRSDLQNSLSSTRDDLNDSIAHNHAELVALERKGERSYYEFSIPKSKQFQREGPIGISLRHTNTKHRNYNLVVLVDDMQLSKKNVNLYEPLVFQTENASQPLQIVVNRVDKNRIGGYVSAPKYSPLEASASVESGSVAAGQQTGANDNSASSPAASGSSPSLHHRAGTD